MGKVSPGLSGSSQTVILVSRLAAAQTLLLLCIDSKTSFKKTSSIGSQREKNTFPKLKRRDQRINAPSFSKTYKNLLPPGMESGHVLP